MSVQLRSYLTPADNSGVIKMYIIGIPGSNKKKAHLADVVTAMVAKASPTGQVADNEKVRAVIVRLRKEHKREDGSYVRFDDNAAVVVDDAGLPRGTRIFGPVGREVRERGFAKIASLAQEVV